MRSYLHEKAAEYKMNNSLYDYRFFIERIQYTGNNNYPKNCEKALEKEQKEYGDIVLLDLAKEEQGWTNLLFKVEKMIQWVYMNNPDGYQYLVKTDDDAIIDVEALYAEMSQIDGKFLSKNNKSLIDGSEKEKFLMNHHHAYAGSGYGHMPVLMQGKYANVPFKKQTGLAHYPPYMSGGMYLLSNSVVRYLVIASQTIGLTKSNMEDAHLGFWISTTNTIRYELPMILTRRKKECKSGKPYILYHPVKDAGTFSQILKLRKNRQYKEACEIVQKGLH